MENMKGRIVTKLSSKAKTSNGKRKEMSGDPTSLERRVTLYDQEAFLITAFGKITRDHGIFQQLVHLWNMKDYSTILKLQNPPIKPRIEQEQACSILMHLASSISQEVESYINYFKEDPSRGILVPLKGTLDNIADYAEYYLTEFAATYPSRPPGQ